MIKIRQKKINLMKIHPKGSVLCIYKIFKFQNFSRIFQKKLVFNEVFKNILFLKIFQIEKLNFFEHVNVASS